MGSYYKVVEFSQLNNRMDSKMLKYKANQKLQNTQYRLVKLGKVIELINSPANLNDSAQYKYYDTSVNSVNTKGEFVNYKIINTHNRPSRAKQLAIKNTIIVANMKTNRGKACIVTEKEYTVNHESIHNKCRHFLAALKILFRFYGFTT